MKKNILLILLAACGISCSVAPKTENAEPHIVSFAAGGPLRMLYDSRQRPQAVYLKDKLHIVFNGGAISRDTKNAKRKAVSKSMAVTYDPRTRTFSESVTIGRDYSSDHHDGPVIWADMEDKLHVFYGWHHDLGTHLISNEPRDIGTGLDDWSDAPAPSSKMSYPWMSRIYDNQQLVFYRTDGHYSSWTYRMTGDNGQTWEGPENDVIDLDLKGGMDTDWSSYLAKEVSKDGNFLHIGFMSYDDYKRPRSPQEKASGKLDRTRQHNPLYDNRKTSNYKYNLYYLRVDLRTHRVIPSMMVDEEDQVSFLHNLSDSQHEKSLAYHYVRRENGVWKHTRIADSNHHWNSGHLAQGADGILHAYVITGEGYFEPEGNMDRYGGGKIEEWTSADQGNTWKKARALTPDPTRYLGWKYNNIQAVRRPDGALVDGMLLFYGWKDKDAPEAQAFLLHTDGVNQTALAGRGNPRIDENR
jgi:hypothetical protein